MGTPAIQSILEALKTGGELKAQRESLAQQAAQNIAENKMRQQQLDIEQKRADQEHALALQSFGLQKTAADYARMLQSQQMLAGIQSGQPAPAGTSITSMLGLQTTPTQEPDTPGNVALRPSTIEGADKQYVDLPNGAGGGTTLTPLEAAKQSASVKTITEAPEQARIIAQQKAQQEAETGRQLLTNAQNLAAEKERLQLTLEKDKWVAQQNNAASYRNAMIPYTIFNSMPPQQRDAIVNPIKKSMMDGDMSVTQMNKTFEEAGFKGAGGAVLSEFMQGGGTPPSDKQVAAKQSLQPLVDLVPKMEEAVQSLQKSDNWIGSTYLGLKSKVLKPEIAAKFNEIASQSAQIAKTIGGENGQRIQTAMLELAQEGLTPGATKPTQYNANIVNNFIDMVQSSLKSQLGSYQPGQYAHVLDTMGWNNIRRMNPDGTFFDPSKLPTQQAPKIMTGTHPDGSKWYSQDNGETWAPMPHQPAQ